MKKWKRLCAALLSGLLLTGSALAAGETVQMLSVQKHNISATAQNTLTFSHDAIISGNQYALLIAKGTMPAGAVVNGTMAMPTIDSTTLTYIDQTTAEGTTVKFENFIPKSVPNSVVLLGGSFNGYESPVVIGFINGQGVLVTGTISIPQNTSDTKLNNVTFTLFEGDNALSNGVVDQNGTFSFSGVADGTYKVSVKKPGCVSASTTVTVEGEEVSIGELTLYAGDVNGNNEINVYDLMDMLDDWGKSSDKLGSNYSDTNENGFVNIYDLFVLLDNFGRKGQ